MPSALPALDALEHRLDALAFRAAARLATRYQTRQRAAKVDGAALASDPPDALRQALSQGALESAASLLERLLDDPELLARNDAVAPALAIEALLMLGQRDRARSLAETYQSSLLTSVSGAAALELVGHEASPSALPNGKPHVLRLSRRLERGELPLGELLAHLAPTPWSFLRNPELNLLCFSALLPEHPARAIRFLNRFLAAYGLTAAHFRAAPPGGNLLQSLAFEPPVTVENGPLVSVLMAAHDAEATIGYALDSLLNQSYRRIEILVGDDASHDRTPGILSERARSEPRLRVFRSTRNQGPYNVKNALARHARGELLTFHDADDLALPDRIARQVAALDGAVANIGNFARVRPHGSFVFFKDQRAVRLGMVTLMLTRQAFDTVGPFRSVRIGADHELHAALRAHFGPAAITRTRSPLILGLWSPSSTTQAPGLEALEDGYRSPARRAYSQLVHDRFRTDGLQLQDEEVEARLQTASIYAPPTDVRALT